MSAFMTYDETSTSKLLTGVKDYMFMSCKISFVHTVSPNEVISLKANEIQVPLCGFIAKVERNLSVFVSLVAQSTPNSQVCWITIVVTLVVGYVMRLCHHWQLVKNA
jgi:hypothetical protein